MTDSCYPLIFTRTKYIDYRLLAVPEFLKCDPAEDLIWDKVTSLCSVDGYRGELVGRRPHVLRLGDYVVFGLATGEFGHIDAGGRKIRGYYGIMFPKECAARLDINKIDWPYVDEKYVKSVFETENTKSLYAPPDLKLSDIIFTYSGANRRKFSFNADKRYIGVIGANKTNAPESLYELLHEALASAGQTPGFELVVGVNFLRHAEEIEALNAVSYDCPNDGLYSLQERKHISKPSAGKLSFFKDLLIRMNILKE